MKVGHNCDASLPGNCRRQVFRTNESESGGKHVDDELQSALKVNDAFDTRRLMRVLKSAEQARRDTHAGTCVNTIQSVRLVADNRGFVCEPSDVLPNGCCDERNAVQHSCESCANVAQQSATCCAEFADCVACCQRSDNLVRLLRSLKIVQRHTVQLSGTCFYSCRRLVRRAIETVSLFVSLYLVPIGDLDCSADRSLPNVRSGLQNVERECGSRKRLSESRA